MISTKLDPIDVTRGPGEITAIKTPIYYSNMNLPDLKFDPQQKRDTIFKSPLPYSSYETSNQSSKKEMNQVIQSRNKMDTPHQYDLDAFN